MADDPLGQDLDQTDQENQKPKAQKPSLGQEVKDVETVAEAVAEDGLNFVKDIEAAGAILREGTEPVKTTAKGLGICCMAEFLAGVTAVFFIINLFNPTSAPGLTNDSGSNSAVVGDTEFWITHYDPAKGGINGRDCGGAMIKVCSDSSSPTGYVGKYNGKVISTGVIAVPQDSKYHSSGKVDINSIPVPLIHSSKVLEQAKIIIPGYNNSQATPVGDHFATTITKPNRLDLACTGTGCSDMWNYWKANKLILDSGSGLNGGSKVMGKVVGTVIR